MRVYRRGELFYMPKRFFEDAAKALGGVFVMKEDWQQILFLCSDSILFGFWYQQPDGVVDHEILGIDFGRLDNVPGLWSLWVHRNIGQTWEVLQEQLTATPKKRDDRAFPSWSGTKDNGAN